MFVNGFLVGHLSREIAGAVQPSLIAFTAANSGRTVACLPRYCGTRSTISQSLKS